MCGGILEAEDVQGASRDTCPADPTADDIGPLFVQKAPAVKGQAEGVPVHDAAQVRIPVKVAHDPRGHDTEPVAALIDFLLCPEGAVVGKRLNGLF